MYGPARSPCAAGVRALLQLAFLANQAFDMVHAVAITLVRLGTAHGRRLEWETAAASAARTAPRTEMPPWSQ
mgnify:CR=1 FL=1